MGGAEAGRVRPPAAAGRFYPAEAVRCRLMAEDLLREAGQRLDSELVGRKRWIGGIVPHAGWVYSGAIAAETMAAVADAVPAVDVVVVFGAVHTPRPVSVGVVDDYERWDVPGGGMDVAVELRRRLIERHGALFVVDDRFHAREHAVEVEVPLIQLIWPEATLLPVEVPAVARAGEVGRETAREVVERGLSVACLASSDLTHYGPGFGFVPAGAEAAGIEWAKENDRRLLEVVQEMRFEAVVPEVRQHRNACGGGAIAAMLAACREMGANEAVVLRHTNSHETGGRGEMEATDLVGYASVVVG